MQAATSDAHSGDDASGSGGTRTPGTKAPILGRWKACSTCRSRKTRCDGAQPTCTPCADAGRDCNYGQRKKGPGATSAIVLGAKVSDLQDRVNKLLELEASTPTLAQAEEPVTSSLAHFVESPATVQATPSPSSSNVVLLDGDRDAIINIFFRYQHRVGCQISPHHFFQSLHEDNESLQPLPALADAMILLGIALAGMSSEIITLPANIPDPSVLLYRVRKGLEKSLEMVDRILDYLQASNLLSYWYLHQGRLQEGQYTSASTFRLAINCRLHQIDGEALAEQAITDNPYAFWDSTILGRPKNSYELYLRVMTFWQCFWYDQVYALITGLPAACDASTTSSITTSWPRPMGDYETGVAADPKYLTSINDLFSGEGVSFSSDDPLSADIIYTYHMKGLTILNRAAHMSTLCSALDDVDSVNELINIIKVLSQLVEMFLLALPTGAAPLLPHQFAVPEGIEGDRTRHAFTFPRLCLHVSQIHLARSAAALTNAKLGWGISNGLDESDVFGILVSQNSGGALPDSTSFRQRIYLAAKTGIDTTSETVRKKADMLSQHEGSTRWSGQISAYCGFVLASPALVMAEHTKRLDMALGNTHGDSLGKQGLSSSLRDAEECLTSALQVMAMLSANFPILNMQIQKIEALRSAVAEK